ncbi:hypothetical protein [Aliidongia dinghuensis]|uniref:hypothetical protein n=1 Tax=Aliidongia dinghuensis TaxID=1867774 RepID=UPI0016645E23|nr:hypothetical protein [Aliidongia dinghuensis]
MRNRDDFAIRLLSRHKLAHYCDRPTWKLRVISDSDDFGDLTSGTGVERAAQNAGCLAIDLGGKLRGAAVRL